MNIYILTYSSFLSYGYSDVTVVVVLLIDLEFLVVPAPAAVETGVALIEYAVELDPDATVATPPVTAVEPVELPAFVPVLVTVKLIVSAFVQ